ncbi:hypothetical protein [Streptomyces macrolidinus]|nr:hypothetical protein [Streptomyces macrolidinus]
MRSVTGFTLLAARAADAEQALKDLAELTEYEQAVRSAGQAWSAR